MKDLIKPSIILQSLVTFLCIQNAFSQTSHVIPVCTTVAVSKKELFFEKPIVITQGENFGSAKPNADTISVSDAKNITALNAIYFYEGFFHKMSIESYEMTIVNAKDTLISAKGTSEELSEEMKNHLNNVQSGSRIYFGNINAKFIDAGFNGIRSMNVLLLIVR